MGKRLTRAEKRKTWTANATILLTIGVVIEDFVKTWSSPTTLPTFIYLLLLGVSTYAISTTRFLLSFYKVSPVSSALRFVQGMIGLRKKQYVIQRLLILFYGTLMAMILVLHFHPLAEKTTSFYVVLSSLTFIILTTGLLIYVRPIISRRLEAKMDVFLEQWQDLYDTLKE